MIVEHIKLNDWNEAVFMTAYVPSMPSFGNKEPRKAVLICPGGAYVGHTEKEMETVALQFLAEGYCAFVLNYAVGAGLAALPTPLFDIGNALAAIEERKNHWGVDSEGIYLLGFSSGAFAVSLYGSLWCEPWLAEGLSRRGEVQRPKAVILAYPTIDLEAFEHQVAQQLPEQLVVVEMMYTALFNTPFPSKEQLEKWQPLNLVSEHTMPTWIWAWSEDPLIEANTLIQYQEKMNQLDLECQLTFFTGCGHGSGLDFGGNRELRTKWFETLDLWLKALD